MPIYLLGPQVKSRILEQLPFSLKFGYTLDKNLIW